MARLVSAVVLALLAPLLAGCSDDGGDAATGTDAPSVIKDPRDLSYLQNNTGAHIHDYWQGRDRITVMDSRVETRWSCGGCTNGMAISPDRPDEGIIVPQGTKWVNGTMWFDRAGDSDYTGLELWVKTAKDAQPQRVGPLEPDVPFAIESRQELNDPPHYILSLWQFQVRALGNSDNIVFSGTYGWKVEAVRGLPLIPYPPHPDRWDGATEIDLLSDSRQTVWYIDQYVPFRSVNCNGISGCPGVHALPDGVVVPWDTARVEARLKYGPGVPTGLGLWFHGADTWAYTKLTGTMAGPDEYVFDVPLSAGVADSPYAPQSLWEFLVVTDQPQGDTVKAWTGQYTLSATAYK